jgi:hypothetical protein
LIAVLRLLGLLLAGLVALVIVFTVLSFVLGFVLKAAFWVGLIAIVAFAVMALTKQRQR